MTAECNQGRMKIKKLSIMSQQYLVSVYRLQAVFTCVPLSIRQGFNPMQGITDFLYDFGLHVHFS